MKILCVCNGGCVRSVALAEFLKGTHGHDAIAAGTFWNTPDTLRMLCEWADLICPVDVRHTDNLPAEDTRRWVNAPIWDFEKKLLVVPIGVDHWGHAKYEDLRYHVAGCWSIAWAQHSAS